MAQPAAAPADESLSLSLPPPIFFDLVRRWSDAFILNQNNRTYFPFNMPDQVNTNIPHDLLPILNRVGNNTSKIERFFFHLKDDHFLHARNTLWLCTIEQAVDAPTTLAALNTFITAISRFTHESLESIGRDATETLRELNRRIQELDEDLAKLKDSATVFKAFFSMIAIGFDAAAVSSPVTTIAVQPLLHYCFDPLWDVVLEKPIIEKKKVLETIQFVTHSAIVQTGRIKDTVQGLQILVDNGGDDVVGHLQELETAMAAAVAQVEMESMEIHNLMQPRRHA